MLIPSSQQDLQKWRSSMYSYQKQKRTKKPFGKDFKPQVSIVKSEQIRQKETMYNPLLQTYKNQKQEQQKQIQQKHKRTFTQNKYYLTNGKNSQRDFDIINLYGSQKQQNSPKSQAPLRNIYNPINNQLLQDYHFSGRDVKLKIQKQFKKLSPKPKDFNIITGEYTVNHQQKHTHEIEQANKNIFKKLEQTHKIDKIYNRYYNPEEQQKYKQQFLKQQQIHAKGQQYSKRFPPSYKNREPLVLGDNQKLTETLQKIDKKRENAKQRYKMRYSIQRQYQRRNIQSEILQEQRLRNRVHNSHSIQNKAKQFNLPELSHYKAIVSNQLFAPKYVTPESPSLKNPYIYQRNVNKQIRDFPQSEHSSRSSNRSTLIKSVGFS